MMKRKLVSKLTVLVAIVFFVTCVYLYAHAGQREQISRELLDQIGSIQDKGSNLGMDWLKRMYVDSPIENDTVAKNVIPPPPRNSQSLKVSDIFTELEFNNLPGGVWKQGFPIQCPRAELTAKPIQVYIVPHSHQDPGWIKTYDEYFDEKTKGIFDSTLKILNKHPEARFTYTEVSFFNSWVSTLNPKQKAQVHRLLRDRRLEIASGGWVMSDEGTTHFQAILDQLVEGQHWLKENFGYLPNTSWVIDAFGHSTSMAYLINKMRIRGHVVNRIHYEVKKYLARKKSLEFKWRQSWDSNGHTDTLTHVLPFYAYDVPHTCGPNPAVCCQFDFARSPTYIRCPWGEQVQVITERNVAERAHMLADQYCQKATLFGDTRILLVPLGDDFRYLKTAEWEAQLNNYKKLITYWDEHPNMGIQARIAVLSDYFDALHRALERNGEYTALTSLSGDLIVYADRDKDYWTGYFTSRPLDKALVRQLQAELRAADVLYVHAVRIASRSPSGQSDYTTLLTSAHELLTSARRTLGLLQHHDSITGTAKPHVVEDYAKRRNVAFDQLRLVSRLSLTILFVEAYGGQTINNPTFTSIRDKLRQAQTDFQHLNTYLVDIETLETQQFWSHSIPSSMLEFVSSGDKKFVLLYNPGPFRRTITPAFAVRISVSDHSIHVSDHQHSEFTPIPVQTVSESTEWKVLHVGPVVLEPLSVTALKFELKEDRGKPSKEENLKSGNEPIVLSNKVIELHFNAQSGLLEQFVNLRTGLRIKVNLEFIRYRSASKAPNSGAYLFVPDGPAEPLPFSANINKQITRGPLFDQIVLFTKYVNHTVRLYKDGRPLSQSIEIQNQVDISEENNMELVLKIHADIGPSSPLFYTDSNCFQFTERSYYPKLPLQGNLYPMTCAAFIQSSSNPTLRLTLLSSYTHGVTSPQSGQLLVWLDRRAPRDDDRGLGKALLGSWSVVSRFNMLFESIKIEPNLPMANVPRLTLQAHLALMDLIQPIQRLLVSPQLGTLPDLNFMVHSILPCNYELVSLRVLTNKPNQSSTQPPLGLWLHHLPDFLNSDWIGDIEESSQPCKVSTSVGMEQLSPKYLFPSLGLSMASRSRRITLVPEPDEAFYWNESISVEPMELDGFLVV